MERRVIISAATDKDISVEMNDYHTGDYNPTITSSSYIYLSSRLPFNSVYMKLSAPSVATANLNVDYWDGDQWRATVDLLDETAGFSQSGYLTWTPDLDYSWDLDHTNHNNETIEGLSDFNIYSRYWVRVGFDGSLDAGTTLSWIGDIFCSDADIEAEFPDFGLSSTKTAFESGKTDWEEQTVIASRELIRDLVDQKIIWDRGQILNRRDYREACVQKVAEIVFRSFGDDFVDQKNSAYSEYRKRLARRVHRVDLDGDAIESSRDALNETGFLNR